MLLMSCYVYDECHWMLLMSFYSSDEWSLCHKRNYWELLEWFWNHVGVTEFRSPRHSASFRHQSISIALLGFFLGVRFFVPLDKCHIHTLAFVQHHAGINPASFRHDSIGIGSFGYLLGVWTFVPMLEYGIYPGVRKIVPPEKKRIIIWHWFGIDLA